MAFQDKSIQCAECGDTFTFGAEEQEFFQSKGYTNEPKRCPSCRQSRKTERYGDSGSSYRPHRPLGTRWRKASVLQRLLSQSQTKQVIQVKPQVASGLGN